MRITPVEYGLGAAGLIDGAILFNQYLLKPALRASEIVQRCDLLNMMACGMRAADQFKNHNLPPPPELIQSLANQVGMSEMLLFMAPALLASAHFLAKAWVANARINSYR